MGASGRVARDPSECGGAPSRLSASRGRAAARDSPSRPPETRLLASVDETPPRPPRRARHCRRDSVIVSGRMPARSKRSLAQLGKHGAKKLKVHHPDEAPAPATKRCRYGWPAPVAAENAPPPSAHGPVRYARPPDLYESVCALSPTELMYHLYEMPAELAILSLPD